MKNRILFFLIIFFSFEKLYADSIQISSKNIVLDKNRESSIFENEVFAKTDKNHTVQSEYAEYNKKTGKIIFKNNVRLEDEKKNKIITQYAEYNEKSKIFKTIGITKITTSENYALEGKDIILNKNESFIRSNSKATIFDKEKNIIYLDQFEYNRNNKIFKSIGNIEIIDKFKNSYNFSQIYIDTDKNEILGTDISAYLKNKDFKINEKNDPRILANTFSKKGEISKFNKSIFTLCGYRKGKNGEKCPPWTIQATEMLHDNKKKTIYYDNAIVKFYNIPIFYIPKLAHPDPSIERRSGFLPATLSDTKNLGTGITVPYFFAIDKDKDFTFTNKFYADEHALHMLEYRQAFRDSNLILDMGYTEGYKNTDSKKTSEDKSHFFSKFVKTFKKDNSVTNLKIQTQSVSNDKYLKLYKIESNLVDHDLNYLENSFNFSHSNDDYFFSVDASMYETLKENYNDKYEYILPEILFDRNLFQSDIFGNLDFQSNFKVNNYDTNKTSKTLINDFNWVSKEINFNNGFNGKFLGQLKNINYENKNIAKFKEDQTSEIHGSLGYLNEIELIKENLNTKIQSLLTPKLLIRYSPGSMKKENDGDRLTPSDAFSLDRLNSPDNVEKGLSATLGFDYSVSNKDDKKFDLSIAQVVSDEENNKKPTATSLDEKLSDLVGTSSLKLNKNFEINYNFSLDQNYSDLNYNEILSTLNFSNLNLEIGYLQEKKHIGNNEYLKTNLNYNTTSNQKISFQNKRSLVTNSSEYYDLSYEYFNDCLRAALVFRREFYNDSELEPENTLMFKITLIPFGDISTPSFSQ